MKSLDTLKETFVENIQLRIDQFSYNILLGDSEYFHFKSLNTLINQVISSLSMTYIEKFERDHILINSTLERYGIDPSSRDNITRDLLVDKFRSEDITSKKDKALKIHVNAPNENDFLYIYQKTSFYKNQIGFPEIIRSILYSYCKLSRSQREITVFSDIYLKTKDAISNKKKVEVYLQDHSVVYLHPYAFINPLDDEGNYLFGEDEEASPVALPLHKIKKIISTGFYAKISTKTLSLYQEMVSTKFNYRDLSELASDNILETVQTLKTLSYLIGNKNQQI